MQNKEIKTFIQTSLRIPMAYDPAIKDLIMRGYYQNRSQLIITALRDLLIMEAPQKFRKGNNGREKTRICMTIYPDKDLLNKGQNLVSQGNYKNISDLVNRALSFYYRNLTEGAKIWQQVIEGDSDEKPVSCESSTVPK